MKIKKEGNKYLFRLDRGEEIISSIKELCAREGIKAGSLCGIGAANHIKIGLFNPEKNIFLKNLKIILKLPLFWGISHL